MDEFAKQKKWRVPPLKELDLSWEDIKESLAKGWNKKQIWGWLSETNRFSYNYLTFLRTISKLIAIYEEEKRKARIEQRRSELANQKKSEQERLDTLMNQYKE